jgi:hypothetical protein
MLELNFRYAPLGKGLNERLGSPFPSSPLFSVSLAECPSQSLTCTEPRVAARQTGQSDNLGEVAIP